MTVPLDHTVQRAEVLWRSSAATVLIRRPGHDTVVVLADTAVELWHQVGRPVVVGELCAAMAESHDAPVGTVVDDVRAALADLIARHVVIDEG